MEKVILKYTVDSKDAPNILTADRGGVFYINMIKNAEIIHTESQKRINEFNCIESPCRIWVLVDKKETETEKRYFRLIETGNCFNDENLKYIGTCKVHDDKIILHLFELINK